MEYETVEEIEPQQQPTSATFGDDNSSLLDSLKIGPRLTELQPKYFVDLVKNNMDNFGTRLMPIGDIPNHEIEINLKIDRPCAPALGKRNMVKIEGHIYQPSGVKA